MSFADQAPDRLCTLGDDDRILAYRVGRLRDRGATSARTARSRLEVTGVIDSADLWRESRGVTTKLDSNSEKAFEALIRSASDGPAKIAVAAATFFGMLASGPLTGAAAAVGATAAAKRFGEWFAANDSTGRLLAAAAQERDERAKRRAREELQSIVQVSVHGAQAETTAMMMESFEQVLRSTARILEKVQEADRRTALPVESETDSFPPERQQVYVATPYALLRPSELAETSQFAFTEFEGDTLPADVVRAAVHNGCALGLRLSDGGGRTVGFLDVFHFQPEVLELWIRGDVAETLLGLQAFHPIPRAGNRTGKLELVVGALYVKSGSAERDLFLAKNLIDAGSDYFNSQCVAFSEVVVYATIFSEPGRRWALQHGFSPRIAKHNRGPHGRTHDVYALSTHPEPRPFRRYQQVSRHSLYTVELADDGGARQ